MYRVVPFCHAEVRTIGFYFMSVWLKALKPVLGGANSVSHFITVNEQSDSVSNPDCSFHSSIVYYSSRKSDNQNLFLCLLMHV